MPKLNRVQIIKYAPPPPELPVFGKVKPEEVSFIGRTNYVASLEEKKFIFGVKQVYFLGNFLSNIQLSIERTNNNSTFFSLDNVLNSVLTIVVSIKNFFLLGKSYLTK